MPGAIAKTPPFSGLYATGISRNSEYRVRAAGPLGLGHRRGNFAPADTVTMRVTEGGHWETLTCQSIRPVENK